MSWPGPRGFPPQDGICRNQQNNLQQNGQHHPRYFSLNRNRPPYLRIAHPLPYPAPYDGRGMRRFSVQRRAPYYIALPSSHRYQAVNGLGLRPLFYRQVFPRENHVIENHIQHVCSIPSTVSVQPTPLEARTTATQRAPSQNNFVAASTIISVCILWYDIHYYLISMHWKMHVL